MKSNSLNFLIAFVASILLVSCDSETKINESSTTNYSVSIVDSGNKNAPALQSFTHATHNGEWLLFAGRTNQSDDNGGVHDMGQNSNYADTSFPPRSFNDSLFVYNPSTDAKPISISVAQLMNTMASKYTSYPTDTLKKYSGAFRNTNSLVKQVDDYLYVIGGYGPISFSTPKNGYITYNQVVKIHVPSLISLVKGDYASVDASKLFAFAQNKNLISTGGELHYFNGTFYLVGGHNFGNTAPNGQKYVDAVYPFSISNSSSNNQVLTFFESTPISDVSDPKGISADDTSIFRRRDGPITASLYYNPITKKYEESIAIYTGVFKPGEDLEAWNDAIYVHPNWAGNNNRLYTYDKAYNQHNYNVYSCPSVVAFDSISKVAHTFLLGGIGDGKGAPAGHLSGFTNTGVHIQLNVDGSPLTSSNTVFSQNLFGGTTNSAPFYGAEAIFFKSNGFTSIKESEEIIDALSTFSDSKTAVEIGYVFGGIESFHSNPGTYGRTKSRASNKVWKVTLTKK